MSDSRLARQIATTIRHERERRELTQQALADLVGLTQGALAHIERGSRIPSLPVLERLLAAMDVQLTVGVEPLDSHLDAALDALADASVVERIREIGLDRMLDALGELPYVLTGSSAALLQGAPLPVGAVEVAVRWRDSPRLTGFLEAAYAQRWNARWEEWGGLRLEPEEPGEHRWQTLHGELRARMCDELPQPVEVRYGGRSYPVEPLVRVELADPRAADLLRRHRQRLGSAG
ncbi:MULTISPECIES: helix-turn-helix domain-containing protein [Micromonospora]|uniref:XRE family transcriptional regulator n=1 Tax=Micromonospora solifontis TaxID=2487138 RepID=A0ABX9WF19_9ACTN|nr:MULTISPECIES: helix-turn-helix transcriptional regulator [Micromonospora]NES12677.1 helix-turn-helix transcriptional regulator [Micromonospora sp. PPF5-17B]NES38189.1 helix-turn-helix transcriptional regulator [Micromonospora solifontis]NES54438.1 helix-turn-helix transcriptional regulator [Micromonospora sp. PPF5-6]RNL96454.1 XRE family transcriptional regulator [Micromonospora solifontis]